MQSLTIDISNLSACSSVSLSKPVARLKVSLRKYTHFFGTVPTNISIIEYGELLAPWFHNTSQQNHPSAEALLIDTEVQTFVSFVRQCAHDSTLPTEHHIIYQKILPDILVDIEADASTFNMIKVTYQAFFWVLIDLIMELLDLSIK